MSVNKEQRIRRMNDRHRQHSTPTRRVFGGDARFITGQTLGVNGGMFLHA